MRTLHRLALAAALLCVAASQVAAQDGYAPSCTEQRIDRHFFLTVDARVCNFYRPGNTTERGPNVYRYSTRSPAECILVNNSFPGPTLRVRKGDWVRVDVQSNLAGREITFHWHGVRQTGTPWSDGAAMINSCPVKPGMGATYIFHADEQGLYFYHGHAGLEEEYGMSGAFLVEDPDDPFDAMELYDEEVHEVLELRDWWWTPDAHAAQALAMRFYQQIAPHGLPLFNGFYGNGSSLLPYPTLDLAANTCYRARFVCANTEWPGWFVSINDAAGNPVNMTMISLTGEALRPFNTHRFAFYIAQRAEAIFCTGAPGIWTMNVNSSQPEDGFCTGPTPDCINGMTVQLRIGAANATAPRRTNRARLNSFPFVQTFDSLIHPEQVVPYVPEIVPQRPTQTWNIYTAIVPGNMYAWTERNWGLRYPTAPPLFTRGGRCGVPPEPLSGQVPNATYNRAYLLKTARHNEVVDIIFNNLSPFFHPMHLHGYDFIVLGSRYYTDAGYTPDSVPQFQNRNRAPEDVCPNGYMWAVPGYDGTPGPPWPTRTPQGGAFATFAFGCPRNASEDNSRWYLQNPYKTDIVPVPPHGWTHVRVRFDNPGTWYLHCHLAIHMSSGMGFMINSGVERVPRIPSWVDTSCMGPCQPLDQTCGPYSRPRDQVTRCSTAPNTCPPRGGISDMIYG